jgi:hypothetical protein
MTLLDPSQAPTALRRTVSSVAPAVVRAVLELGLVIALFELYRVGRLIARGESTAAYQHALQVHHRCCTPRTSTTSRCTSRR